ncbi:hypothetical protein Tco_1298783 [Tanacetum coccineum]
MIFEDYFFLTTCAVSSKEDTAYQHLDFTRKHVRSIPNMAYPAYYIRLPTGRVVVPPGRYVVPAGKVIIIVSPSRLSLVPTGRILSPGSKDLSRVESNKWYQSLLRVSLKKNILGFKILINLTTKHLYIPLKCNILKRTGRDCDGRVIILPPMTADEHIAVQRESKARTTLLQSIPDDHVANFHYMDDARDISNFRELP